MRVEGCFNPAAESGCPPLASRQHGLMVSQSELCGLEARVCWSGWRGEPLPQGGWQPGLGDPGPPYSTGSQPISLAVAGLPATYSAAILQKHAKPKPSSMTSSPLSSPGLLPIRSPWGSHGLSSLCSVGCLAGVGHHCVAGLRVPLQEPSVPSILFGVQP